MSIKENIYARLIQKAWRRFRCRKDELDSITEDFAIVDYTFRMERMFGYKALPETTPEKKSQVAGS